MDAAQQYISENPQLKKLAENLGLQVISVESICHTDKYKLNVYLSKRFRFNTNYTFAAIINQLAKDVKWDFKRSMEAFDKMMKLGLFEFSHDNMYRCKAKG